MAKKRYHSSERGYEKRMGEIRSEHNDYANMPQNVVHKAYPSGHYGLPGGYDDNMMGIDAKAKQNHSKLVSQMRGGDNDYR